MIIAKVIGHVVSTQKKDELKGCKLLIVTPINHTNFEKEDTDTPQEMIVSIDMVGAGVGETVVVSSGRAAINAMGDVKSPVDSAIVGIVDTIDLF